MGCSAPLSVFHSTIPAMKKLNEMYKLYRELPVFQALFQSMIELGEQDLLPVELVPTIVHTYDQTIVDIVRSSQGEYNITGKLAMYRILHDHSWFVLSNVTIYQPLSVKDISNKKGRKLPKLGRRIGKFDKIKFWCHDPINDSSLMQVDIGSNNNPYVIEVEKKLIEKKKKVNLSTKKETPMGYNPLIHTTLLGVKDKDFQKQDYSKPMPYNEKLRRARGVAEDVMAIATSQVGPVEVLKGRFRKKAKEFPYRCVEDDERRLVDLRVVSGRKIARRDYMVLMKSQDKTLAKMAEGAGGILAMTPHNIHVVEEYRGEERESVRESYGTRRKNKIEHATFDSVQNYIVVMEEPKKRVDTDSDTTEDESIEEERATTSHVSEAAEKICLNEFPFVLEKCRPKSRQATAGEGSTAADVKNISEEGFSLPVNTREAEDEYGFLDELVMKDRVEDQDDQMAIDKMLDFAVSDSNDNRFSEENSVQSLKVDEANILNDDFLDLFNSQHDIFPSTTFSELNQTLDTNI